MSPEQLGSFTVLPRQRTSRADRPRCCLRHVDDQRQWCYLSGFALTLLAHHPDRTAAPGLFIPSQALLCIQTQFPNMISPFPIFTGRKKKLLCFLLWWRLHLMKQLCYYGNGLLTAFGHFLIMRAGRGKREAIKIHAPDGLFQRHFSPQAPVKGTGFQQAHFL